MLFSDSLLLFFAFQYFLKTAFCTLYLNLFRIDCIIGSVITVILRYSKIDFRAESIFQLFRVVENKFYYWKDTQWIGGLGSTITSANGTI